MPRGTEIGGFFEEGEEAVVVEAVGVEAVDEDDEPENNHLTELNRLFFSFSSSLSFSSEVDVDLDSSEVLSLLGP